MLIASDMICGDLWPLMLAMKPTPQESFSSEGSYMPSGGGRQECSRAGSTGFEAGAADSAAVPMFSRSNSDPLISILSTRLRATASSAHLGRLRHPPGHRSSSASRNFRIQAWAFNVPEERPLPLYFRAPEHPTFVAIPVPGLPHN